MARTGSPIKIAYMHITRTEKKKSTKFGKKNHTTRKPEAKQNPDQMDHQAQIKRNNVHI